MKNRQRGNIIFYILIVIILVALLTQWVTKSTQEQSSSLSRQTIDDEISRMQAYASTLAGAINQMAVNGEDTSALYSNLDVSPPGTGTFANGVNNNFKIFHPLGGGIAYMSASSNAASPVATAFNIVPGAIVTGVGPTDAVTGDILFVATISSATYCQRINQLLTGSTTVPVMDSAVFTSLFSTGTAVTLGAANCASCVAAPRLCVSNAGATAWGYYAALFPG